MGSSNPTTTFSVIRGAPLVAVAVLDVELSSQKLSCSAALLSPLALPNHPGRFCTPFCSR